MSSVTKRFLTILSLIFLWIGLSLVFGSYKSFSVLQYPYYNDKNNDFFEKTLLKGQKISGDFIAKDNHLGIVSVQFNNIPRVEFDKEDSIVFRIKEKNGSNWASINEYRSGALMPDEYYPFGFKEFSESKGREYVFEIYSENGNKNNAVQTGSSSPIYLTKYKYPKSEIFGSFGSFFGFISGKLFTFLTNFDYLLFSTIFLLPLLLYICLTFLPLKKWAKESKNISIKKVLISLTVCLILYNLIFYEFYNLGFIVCLLCLWIGVCSFFKLESRKTFIFGFSLLIIAIIDVFLQIRTSVNKETSFAYYLIVFGFIQSLYEYKGNKLEKRNHFK